MTGPLVIVGFGAIGKATLPMLLRHIKVRRARRLARAFGNALPGNRSHRPQFDRARAAIVDPDAKNKHVAEASGIAFVQQAVTTANMRALLGPLLTRGGGQGFLVNVSVDVSSMELIRLCRDLGALYLDTCIEPEPGVYTDPSKTMSERSNYALREAALSLREPGTPTAVVGHGANPGLVSHLAKAALLQLARDTTGAAPAPQSKAEWAVLARDLGVKGIHIAERDTQKASVPKQMGEFVNTWSVDGFLSEGLQPAELGFVRAAWPCASCLTCTRARTRRPCQRTASATPAAATLPST